MTPRDPPPAPAASVVAAALDLLRRADRSLGSAELEAVAAAIGAPPAVPARRPGAAAAPGRWQDVVIEREIPEGASVLDLGCGGGELLERLIRLKRVRGQGIELDPERVMECVARDVPVFQSNLDEGLQGLPSGGFDYVVLEETLQTLHRPIQVLDEMLRVGRHGIVSFPNFGYWRVRLMLALEGRMPMTEGLPYRWHDTPNIHLFCVRDFRDWTAAAGVRVVRAFAFAEGRTHPLEDGDDLHAEEALFFVARG